MSRLVVVPTPIGNLEDITFRAIKELKQADFILAEDTRVSKKLLMHYEISVPCKSFHQHNEHKILASVVARIQSSTSVALISDAGTPGISDPGFLLVRACVEAGIEVICLPGATAFVPALVCSGLPCDKFVFEGFLPHKKGRKTRIESFLDEDRSVVLYESPYRVVKTLNQLMEILGPDRLVSASREISKIYEETVRGSLAEVAAHFELKGVKGEFVIILAGKNNKSGEELPE